MLTFILVIGLVFTTIILTKFETNRFMTPYTPFALFSVPYLIVVFYQVIITNIYDWKKITPLFLIIILVYFVNFFLVGNLFLLIRNRKYKNNKLKKQNYENFIFTRYKAVELLSIISAIILINYFLIEMIGLHDFRAIVQEPFQVNYSSGFRFYLKLLSMIGTVYFWGLVDKTNKKEFLYGLLCFIPNFITFVKGISFILIIGSVISNAILHNRKFKLKLIIQIGSIGVILFFIVYMIELGIWDHDKLLLKETYKFIYGKLNAYIVSGVQSFNVNINSDLEMYRNIPNVVLSPLINLIAKTGLIERIDNVSSAGTLIGYIPYYGPVSVNTNTYIGTIALYNGIFIGLLINSMISILIYYFFYSAIRQKNILAISRYGFFSSGITLAWFEYYYLHPFWFYAILIYFMLNAINKYRIKIK